MLVIDSSNVLQLRTSLNVASVAKTCGVQRVAAIVAYTCEGGLGLGD